MKKLLSYSAIILAVGLSAPAQAKGCLKGAAVGGVAGHFSGHHGIFGAAVGCVIGRHEANKRNRMQSGQTNETGQNSRELRNGEERL